MQINQELRLDLLFLHLELRYLCKCHQCSVTLPLQITGSNRNWTPDKSDLLVSELIRSQNNYQLVGTVDRLSISLLRPVPVLQPAKSI